MQRIRRICVLIFIISLSGCSIFSDESKLAIYTISPEVCSVMFGVPPELSAVQGGETFPYCEYDSKYVDKDGNFVIVLDGEQRKVWMDYHMTELENGINVYRDEENLKIVVDLEKQSAEFWVTPEHISNFVGAVFGVGLHVAPLNMLDGVGMLTWTMDVVVYNQRKDELLWQCKYPDEMPNFDWEGFEISKNEALI